MVFSCVCHHVVLRAGDDYPLGLCISIFFTVVIRNFPIPLRLLLPYFSVLSSFAVYQQLFQGSLS